jgi:hypothetical protein
MFSFPMQSPRSWNEGYQGMVEVSHALAAGKSAAEQQTAVLKVQFFIFLF